MTNTVAFRTAAWALLVGAALLLNGCATVEEGGEVAADQGEPVYIPEEVPEAEAAPEWRRVSA